MHCTNRLQTKCIYTSVYPYLDQAFVPQDLKSDDLSVQLPNFMFYFLSLLEELKKFTVKPKYQIFWGI